jgi:ubiquinol-cytochrome c reductase cytochrome b subunit
VIGILYLWPWLERTLTGDEAFHNLLERPRDNPRRTATVLALLVWVFLVFMAGSADRVYVFLGLSYSHQIWAYRVAVVVVPVVTWFVTRRVCRELLAGEVVQAVHERAKEEAVPSEA